MIDELDLNCNSYSSSKFKKGEHMKKQRTRGNATKFTVEITVHENWTRDGVNLMRHDQEAVLKDVILENMLSHAHEDELKLETVKSEVSEL